MKYSLYFLIILLLALSSCIKKVETNNSQAALTIKIVDRNTGNPLPNTLIFNNNFTSLTDSAGQVRFDTISGKELGILITRFGYFRNDTTIILNNSTPSYCELELVPDTIKYQYIDLSLTNSFNTGWQLAETEIREGKATFYTYGNFSEKRRFFHPYYKLPFKIIVGCEPDSHVRQVVEGHNARILKEISNYGFLPYDSLWELKTRQVLHRSIGYGKFDDLPKLWYGSQPLFMRDSTVELSLDQSITMMILKVVTGEDSYIFEIDIDKTDTLLYADCAIDERYGYLIKRAEKIYLIDYAQKILIPLNFDVFGA